MKLPFKSPLPLFELTLLLVVLIIAWAEVRLYRISQEVEDDHRVKTEEISRLTDEVSQSRQQFERERRDLRFKVNQSTQQALNTKQENEQMEKVFNDLRLDFNNLLPALEKAQTRDNVMVQDATRIKEEYLTIAEHLDASVSAMQAALTNFVSRKASTEAEAFDRHHQELRGWLTKEKERIEMERLPTKSRELQETIRREQLGTSNTSLALAKDIGRLMIDIGRAYTNYITNAVYVLNNLGKPITGNVTPEINKARQQYLQLTRLASQARTDGKTVETFLEPEWQNRQVVRQRAIQSIVKAQAELQAARLAHTQKQSNAVLAAAESDTNEVSVSGASTLAASNSKAPSFGFIYALYPMILAQVGLTVFLMVAIYRRVVVEGLRFRLYESTTENKLAHVGQLAAWLAHEIRQPLTAINAWLWTLQRTVSEGMPEHMGAMAMRKEINRLDQIVKDFLRFTQPAAPKLVPVQAESVLQEIQTLLAPQLERQNVQLELGQIDEARFFADPQQFKQVLMNLVTNAAESIEQDPTMDSGTITLRARRDKAQLKGDPSDVVVIEVEDTGPGIAPEVQQRLFDPFFSTKEEGTGMGLPIAAKILETHGGELKFKTELGSGTTFRIVMPVARKADQYAQSPNHR